MASIELFRYQFHPLHHRRLLFGVNKRFEKEGRRQLSSFLRDIRLNWDYSLRDVTADLPHEIEIGVLENVLILNETHVVLPYPIL